MINRNQSFVDILAHGLKGAKNFDEYIDTLFADKYNNPQLLGFEWDDEVQDGFEYSQIEAEADLYTMATIVDYDAFGGIKGFRDVKASSGDIPRMRHGFRIDERTIREKTNLAIAIGGLTPSMKAVIENKLFNSVDKLLGGNAMTLNYMRHQLVSTGKYSVTGENNIGGLIGLTFDFQVPATSKLKAGFGTYGTKYAWTNALADPIGDLRDMVQFAKDNNLEYGHFELCEAKWAQFRLHPNVIKTILTTNNPMTIGDNIPSIMMKEELIMDTLIAIGMPRIVVITDDKVNIEKMNRDTMKLEYVKLDAFDTGAVVLVPDGALGTIKAVKPLAIGDPAARETIFNERTLITQMFNAKTKTQEIESELTALVVPNRARHFVILDTTAATA